MMFIIYFIETCAVVGVRNRNYSVSIPEWESALGLIANTGSDSRAISVIDCDSDFAILQSTR